MSIVCRSLLLLSTFIVAAGMKEHVLRNATVPTTESGSVDDAGVCSKDSDLIVMLQSKAQVASELQPADEAKSHSEPLTLIEEMQWSGDNLQQKGHEGTGESANRIANAKCARPQNWCTDYGWNAASYTEIDCDGDGVKDPYCQDYWYSGFISSASSCQITYPHGGCQASYVPGTPGANWTAEEMLIVRAKIQRVLNESSALTWEAANSHFGHGTWFGASWRSWLTPATILRLGFHDCLKYKDGTGGCDGCLQWDGMEHSHVDYGRGAINSTDRPDGGNNGLTTIAHVLEAIYVDARFPALTPRLPISLQASGKSRADLWAFAVIESVRYTMELNNWACDEPDEIQKLGHGYCAPRLGESDCKFAVPVFSFQTGRKDCNSTSSPGFKTNKAESHPNPHWNGKKVVDFMQRDFGFAGQETVAIMGAHTLGKFNIQVSLFRYNWKTASEKLFNNGYYRNLAMKPDWYYPSGQVRGLPCGANIVANATGERPLARFTTYAWGDTDVGGPVQWVQEKYVCPDCRTLDLTWARSHYDQCCKPEMSTQFEANLNQTVAEQKAIDYGLPGWGTSNCPANFEAIPDKAACVQAANSLQRVFDDEYSRQTMANHPHGCLHHQNGKVYFNPNGNKAQSDTNHRPVCRANVSPYTKAPAGSYVCPAESKVILDKGACKLAAQSLNMAFGGEPVKSWGQHLPRGCLWHYDGKVYFNPHGQNNGMWDQGPLCQKPAIPKPSSAACKTIGGQACVFPFKYKGNSYSGCATHGHNKAWCYTKVDQTGQGVTGHWGACASSCRLDYKAVSYQGCAADCMAWKFIPGADECMLGSDMGLYLDFNVSDDGIPFGCPGFENYNMNAWGREPWTFPRRAEPQCSLNTLSVPAGTASLSQVVELYANNQTQFVNDFALALTKMLSNGYSNLTPAPASGMTGFTCPYQWSNNATRFYNCQRRQ